MKIGDTCYLAYPDCVESVTIVALDRNGSTTLHVDPIIVRDAHGETFAVPRTAVYSSSIAACVASALEWGKIRDEVKDES